MVKFARAAALAAAVLGFALPADVAAQTYPTRPVRLIVPFPPGGATDIIARLLSDKLNALWGQNVLVDYKPGAGSVVGTDVVAKSAPDGYTIGIVITAHLINPSLRDNLPYDTLRDFAGVSMVAISHIVITANKDVPISSLAELIAYAKANPGKLNYGTPGTGTSMHLAAELLKTRAGIDIVHVPYRGGAAAMPDLIAGRIQLYIDPIFASLETIRAGTIKPIAVTGARRAELAPIIPAIGEMFGDFNVLSITGLVVPKATPRPIVEKISADIEKVLKDQAMIDRMRTVGMEPQSMKPDQFDAFVKAEIEKLAPVIKASGARAGD